MYNFFGVNIHFYGILIGLGVWMGLEISLRTRPLLKKEIDEAFVWAMVGGVMGARLYHIIDYWNRYYSNNFWKIIAVWEGGLGIWGAIVGAILGILIYGRLKNIKILPIMDAFAVGAPVAQAVGRLGNWVNGELIGKNGQPLFAYEAVMNTVLFILLISLSRFTPSGTSGPLPPKWFRNDGRLFGIYLIGYGVIRILLEGLRPNEIIWRIGGVPVAIIFGVMAIAIGMCVFNKKRLRKFIQSLLYPKNKTFWLLALLGLSVYLSKTIFTTSSMFLTK